MEDTAYIEEVDQEQQDPKPKPKKVSVKDFAAKIKAKYPDYKDVDDTELTNKIIAKYPEYKDQVELNSDTVKKKSSLDFSGSSLEAGNSLSQSNGVDGGQIPTIEMYTTPSGEMVEADPITLSKKYTELSNKRKQSDVIGGSSFAMGTGSNDVPDEEALKSAKKLKEDFPNLDFEGISKETEGIPDEVLAVSGKELMRDREQNNPLYQRKLANIKWRTDLKKSLSESNIDGEQYNRIMNEVDNLPVYTGSGDFTNQRGAIKSLAADIQNFSGKDKDKILQNFAVEVSKVYGNAYNNNFDKIVTDSPESKYLNNDEQLALQYLKDIAPEQASQYDRLMIDPKILKDNPDALTGYNRLKQTLEETGIGLQLNSVKEELNNLNNIADRDGALSDEQINKAVELEKKYGELVQKTNELDKKYPDRIENKVDDALQEIMGQKISGLNYFGGTGFNAIKNTAQGIWESVSQPFMSDASNTMRELAIMGDTMEQNKIYHKTDSNKALLTDTMVIQPELQTQIDAIKNDKIMDESTKEMKIYRLLKDNTDKFGRVPIKGGKFNINPSSIMYGLSDLGTTLLPFVALEAATGGGATAGAARKFISTFTAAAATTFHDEYASALMNGKSQSEAYKEAMGMTAISSLAMAGAQTPSKIKAMVNPQTSAGKLILSMSEDAIQQALDKGVPKGLKGLKQAFGDRLKAVPKQFAEGAKTGAEFEVAMNLANEAKHQIYDTEIDREQNFKQSLLGILNFGIAGTGFGQAGFKSPTELQKSTLVQFGEKPKEYISVLDGLKKDGKVTPAEYDHRKSLIESSEKAYQSLPQSLNEKQKSEYLYQTVIKNEANKGKSDLPPKQAAEAEKTALVADHTRGLILDNPTEKQLNDRKGILELKLEPKKDAEGKVIEIPEKEKLDMQAELEAINNHLENKQKEVVDTKLSQPIEGVDEQGVPNTGDVPPPTDTKPTDVQKFADELGVDYKKGSDVVVDEKNIVNDKINLNEKEINSEGQNQGSGNNTPTFSEKSNKEKQLTIAEKAKGIEDITDPYDKVLQHFANDGKIHSSAIEELFGGKDSRIRQKSSTENEKRARISLIGKDAPTIDKLAHELWQSDTTGKHTTEDYKDAIERVLSDYNSKSAMQKDLVERYDIDAAYEKYLNQSQGKEAMDAVNKMSDEEINHLLELDANKASEEEIHNYIESLSTKPDIKNEEEKVTNDTKQAEGTGKPEELVSEVAPEAEEPKKASETKELDKLANNVPDSGKITEYMGKDTIEKYTGETPTNDQSRGIQELEIALNHGEKIIEKAKEIYGKDYAEKTLEYIDNSTASVSNRALMYVSLENALGREKLANPDKAAELTKQQALVYKSSQAFARENSLALNYQRLRKIAQVGYDINKVTDNFFSPDELIAKKGLEKAIEADADTINKEAEFQEAAGMTPEIEKQINEGVAKEIEKIYEKLPKEKKTTADKAIAALESVQAKLRSKTYDATVGIPVAIVDAGITTIKLAIKAGVKISDAIELGINKIKEKYGKKWDKEDEFRKDVTAAFSKVKSTKDLVKGILIEKGFGREVSVKGEKKKILDWKKLAGEAGTVSKISENVADALKDKNYSAKEVEAIKDELVNEYINLRTSVIEKAQNELAKRNKETVSAEQKSAAKKLAELYTYGLFEEKAPEFENTLNKALGAKVSEAGYNEAKAIAKGLETIYTASFNGVKLNDVSAKAAIEKLEDRLRVLLFRESKAQGNNNLKLANIVRNYFEIQQTMVLNNLKQAFENPLSGLQQESIDKITSVTSGENTKALAGQRRKLMMDVYKDMMLNGGIGYGKVESTFVNRQHIDDYVNKLSDSKLYHGIASVVTGKATLNTMDAMFKASITEKKFTSNLIKILTHETNPNKMGKEDALKFVSEKLTGQTFKDAQVTAKNIIEKINSDAGSELISTNPHQVDRFANDIVKASLERGGKITPEQITAAYNAAYKSAGLGLGHTANNIISSMMTDYSAKVEGNITQAIKNKEWNRAAMLTYKSILFRNVLNPFVGGGTNWLVLKLEKTGLGLFTGLAYKIGSKGSIDVSTELGMKRLEERLYNQARAKDNFMRGVVGGAASLLTYGAFMGLANTDDYRKWRGNNRWAARYLDVITPEYLLAHMAVKDKKIERYVGNSFNKNDAFDASTKLVKAGVYAAKGDSQKAWGAVGEAIGSKLNAPLPWRLVKDGQVIYQGIKGQDPYHGDYKPSEGFMSGVLQGGVIEWFGARPMGDPEPHKKETKQSKHHKQKKQD